MAPPSSCQKRPLKFTSGSVQSARIRSSPSVNRARKLARSTPNAENIRFPPPVAMPTSSRPRLIWSSVLRLLARCTGLCRVVRNTAQPSRIRSVQAAA
jgi:hypothetical protein